MGDDMVAVLLALATENAELRDQLATAQEMLVETAIDAGNLHALIEAVQSERDAWRAEAEAFRARITRSASMISRSTESEATPHLPSPMPIC